MDKRSEKPPPHVPVPPLQFFFPGHTPLIRLKCHVKQQMLAPAKVAVWCCATVRRATFLESEETLVDKFMPSLDPADPIVSSLLSVCQAKAVTGFELLDKRWNGNEVMKYTTDIGDFFVKMNRVEDKGLLMSEAMSLTSIERTKTIRVPKPLYVGELPRVGDVGPGSFLIAEYLRCDSSTHPHKNFLIFRLR